MKDKKKIEMKSFFETSTELSSLSNSTAAEGSLISNAYWLKRKIVFLPIFLLHLLAITEQNNQDTELPSLFFFANTHK